MTRVVKLWVLLVLGVFGYLAVAVMLDATPGRGTEGFGDIAALIDAKADEHGRIFTGIGLLVVGVVLAMAGVARADGPLPKGGRHDHTGGFWFGGDGCDGGD